AGRIERIAELIRAEEPDFVFMSEVFTECGPCPVNQAAALAKAAKMHAWAFGEDYNIGFPGYRIVTGNVILSRWPMSQWRIRRSPAGNRSTSPGTTVACSGVRCNSAASACC